MALARGAVGFGGYAFSTQSWMMYGWMVASPLFTNLFGFFTARDTPVYFPGGAFPMAGSCVAVAAVLLARMHVSRAKLALAPSASPQVNERLA